MWTKFATQKIQSAILTIEQPWIRIEVIRRNRNIHFIPGTFQRGPNSSCVFGFPGKCLNGRTSFPALLIIATEGQGREVESTCSFLRHAMHSARRIARPSFSVPHKPGFVVWTKFDILVQLHEPLTIPGISQRLREETARR